MSVENYLSAVIWFFAVLVLLFLVFKAIGLRIVSSNQIGVIEKWWSRKGSLTDAIIALNGEAGYQPNVLRGGIHFLTPLMYRVHILPLVTIPQGKIGYVFARDGRPLSPGQTLGRVVAGNFQDVKAFIENGGERGPQRAILREGTYAFNLAQFIIVTESQTYYLPMGQRDEENVIENMTSHLSNPDVLGFTPLIIRGSDDKTGIVTVHDGPSLGGEDIIAPPVGNDPDAAPYHNNFQDPEAFLAAGGFRGRQYQVLTEGTYFINKLFATVELIDKLVIPVGMAGVVVSYFGPKGVDTSGESYRHGELVENGFRGVWQKPLMPGKYAFNTYAGKVIQVPTTNIILKWIKNEVSEYKFDANLAEVGLITRDAFEPLLPLSVVIHIDYMKASLVIQRFGDVQKLVEQTLDPMVSAYFKNIGQQMTLIELIQKRNEIQNDSSVQMKERFERYNLSLEEVLIGTPHSREGDDKIETILTQLRDRQIATEKLETFKKQETAAQQERILKKAQAAAARQTTLTESEVNIQVEENQGKADLAKARQEADKTVALAGADAMKVKMLAEAEAARTAKVGIAEAMAIEQKVDAYGGPQAQVMQDIMSKVAKAIEISRVPIVPETVINMDGSSGDGGGANALSLLLTMLSAEKLGIKLDAGTRHGPGVTDEKMAAIREDILDAVQAQTQSPHIPEKPIKPEPAPADADNKPKDKKA